MLFALIAVAMTYYLVGFGHAAEYELTNREIQELRIENVPDDVVKKLEPLVGVKVAPKKAAKDKAEEEKAPKEACLSLLRARLTPQEWAANEAAITRVAASKNATEYRLT